MQEMPARISSGSPLPRVEGHFGEHPHKATHHATDANSVSGLRTITDNYPVTRGWEFAGYGVWGMGYGGGGIYWVRGKGMGHSAWHG